MKYTPEERLEIGRQIYETKTTYQAAAESFNISPRTAYRYLWLYRNSKGLPSRSAGRPEGMKYTTPTAASKGGGIEEYEKMTREELIRELVLSKINEERAKKGYVVKGVGAEKEYIEYDSKNTK